jgi:putative thioredoxin
MVDVTDATFATEVLARSAQVPVVVDLWAEWCGPCRVLGPILEQVVGETDGAVVLAKVDVDANPEVAAAFQVQGIPAVFALRDGAVVDSFVGAQPEAAVREFVQRLAPALSETDLLAEAAAAAGDEAGLRQVLDAQSDHPLAVGALAALLIAKGEPDEAIALLGRLPETAEVRHLLAEARLAQRGEPAGVDVEARLAELLERAAADDEARQEFLDLLESLGPEDPRTATWRRALSSKLF